MKQASEYRQHAAECRTIAAGMAGEQREQLLRMAARWEELARDRELMARPADTLDGRRLEGE